MDKAPIGAFLNNTWLVSPMEEMDTCRELKCRNCHELFMVTYLIGNVKQLEEMQRISKQTPIKPIK